MKSKGVSNWANISSQIEAMGTQELLSMQLQNKRGLAEIAKPKLAHSFKRVNSLIKCVLYASINNKVMLDW